HDRSGHYEILSACHLAGFTPEAIHHAQDTQAVADLVEATGTVSLTSRFATYQSAAVRVPLGDEPALHRQLLLCTLTGSETRSEEHTSELQSRFDLVCRLLLENKKFTAKRYTRQEFHP